MDSILTVIDPASSYDLVDLDAVKDELGIPDTDTSKDARLQRWITSTAVRFANICGVVFPEENVSEVFRLLGGGFNYSGEHQLTNYHGGYGWGGSHPYGLPIRLRRRPVTFISAVLEGTNALLPEAYETNMPGALIYRLVGNSRGNWCGSGVTVQYSAGYYPIPADVQEAVLMIIRHKYLAAGRDPLLKRFSIENVGAEDYWVPLTQQGIYEGLPPDLQPVADIIATYRDHVVQ
jgi:hypothetical protein